MKLFRIAQILAGNFDANPNPSIRRDQIVDVMGDVLGADAAAMVPAGAAQVVAFPAPPGWRVRLGPGVPKPGGRNYPLPLVPDANGGIFTPAVTAINYTGRPQKAWRGERIACFIGRSAGAGGVLPIGRTFVGSDIVGVSTNPVPLDIYVGNAFDTSLVFPEAEPGIDVTIAVTLQGVLPAGESINLAITILGSTQA